MDSRLSGQVALVTGATRGAGRGIAVELGAAGATVYCTGRSSRGTPSPMGRPETIEETADLVTAAGGTGIAVRVDHTRLEEVADLFDRIDQEQDGRLDVLVNDIWGGDPLLGPFGSPFWEQDLPTGLEILHNAVDTHIIASWHAAPRMVARGRGLMVEITDGQPENYHDHLFYDLPKKTAMRLALAYAAELGPHGITGVAISPGWLRSEAMLERHGVTEDNWQDWYWDDQDHRPARWLASQTPRYTGRGVVALAADPDPSRWNGRAVKTEDLAGAYGFTDLNGTQPGHGRLAWDLLGSLRPNREDYAL
ncbi:SDR family oxidoreductase [Microlunatus parietis]|uniref:NAD(P)-dependent dehydrogenase (Short-subunit alcohol dehydrogenase family) n=1 Tax=Microlunatus parietis TaxID=682979 RepID=A0A7Y9LCU9_9ACTN|nr:SDR family oxidoreductase [Microlunatus parietis]NYE71296.1 NAD(P)-dependent dehydrogenase (short-subunit alcohol dehydrogenase family) [Microlunatus parietis]